MVSIITLTLAGMKVPNPKRYGAVQFPLNILLVHGWQVSEVQAWNFPSWSVRAEWAAYLVFPYVVVRMSLVSTAGSHARALVAASCFLLTLVAIAPLLLGDSFFNLHTNFGRYRVLPEFLLGIAMYELGARGRLPLLAHPLLFVGLILLLASFAWLNQLTACVGVLALLIMSAAEIARQSSSSWLSAPAPRYLGEVSYSLYMVHIPVANVLFRVYEMKFGKFPLWFRVVGVVLTLGVAIAAYRCVEKPAHRFLVNLIKRYESRQA